jgi:undecaprenyl pyrophosphate synthase
MSGDASGKPTPSYKEILRSKDKAVSEANTLLKGERKNRSVSRECNELLIEIIQIAIFLIENKNVPTIEAHKIISFLCTKFLCYYNII